jgi:hypothetical protein
MDILTRKLHGPACVSDAALAISRANLIESKLTRYHQGGSA